MRVRQPSRGSQRLREAVLARFERAAATGRGPLQPPRVRYELRQALGPADVLVSDVGLHKLWIGRMFPAREPHTVLIANGLAGMGFALPAAVAAKLVDPNRGVVAVTGDGGFLMNAQELETAARLGTPFVTVVWGTAGMAPSPGSRASASGATSAPPSPTPTSSRSPRRSGWPPGAARTPTPSPTGSRHALTLDTRSLLAVPIDYSVDVAITDQLGEDTVAA